LDSDLFQVFWPGNSSGFPARPSRRTTGASAFEKGPRQLAAGVLLPMSHLTQKIRFTVPADIRPSD
jgi:hypothetical protein